MENTNINLASDIVIAFVSQNTIAANDVPSLINRVHATLEELSSPAVKVEVALEPAVSIKASVKHEHVTCLDCGYRAKMLKRHINSKHGLTEDKYRERWGLPADHALVAPAYTLVRRSLAKQIGLGRKPGKAPR